MNSPAGSLTAAGAASLRAAHQLIDAAPRILADPVILQLLEPAALEEITANPGYFREPRLLGLRSHIVLRSRYTEDRLSLERESREQDDGRAGCRKGRAMADIPRTGRTAGETGGVRVSFHRLPGTGRSGSRILYRQA